MAKTEQPKTTDEPTHEPKNAYEIGYLLNASLSPEEVDSHTHKISSLIQKNSWGIVTKETQPQKIKLAYPIRKQKYAYFGIMNFELTRKDLDELRKKLRLEQNLLRCLVVSLDVKKLITSPSRRQIRRRPTVLKTAMPVESQKEKTIKMKELEKKLEEIIEG